MSLPTLMCTILESGQLRVLLWASAAGWCEGVPGWASSLLLRQVTHTRDSNVSAPLVLGQRWILAIRSQRSSQQLPNRRPPPIMSLCLAELKANSQNYQQVLCKSLHKGIIVPKNWNHKNIRIFVHYCDFR